jgi:unconventional prefoldin RPB5 interactor 1
LFPAKAEKPFSRPIVADLIADDVPSRSEPRPPKGITLADTLVERETSGSTAAPPEPDELDEQLHRQEIATEFYKMSNRVIHQNGGFLNDDEQEIVPLDDAPGQPTKKVSRFMAARMK